MPAERGVRGATCACLGCCARCVFLGRARVHVCSSSNFRAPRSIRIDPSLSRLCRSRCAWWPTPDVYGCIHNNDHNSVEHNHVHWICLTVAAICSCSCALQFTNIWHLTNIWHFALKLVCTQTSATKARTVIQMAGLLQKHAAIHCDAGTSQCQLAQSSFQAPSVLLGARAPFTLSTSARYPSCLPLLAEDGVCACRQATNQWPDVTSQSRQCVHPQETGRRRGFHLHAAACAAALALMPLARWRGQLLPTCAATLAMLTPCAASSRFRFPTFGRWKVGWLLSWMPAGSGPGIVQSALLCLTHLPCTAGQAGAHCATQPSLQARALRRQMPPTGVARVMLRAEGQGSTDASQPAARQHLCPQTASASASS